MFNLTFPRLYSKLLNENSLQVINQYEQAGAHLNRYDVSILVNGLPMVHVVLKRRGVELKEVFNQINRYQRDSFWAETHNCQKKIGAPIFLSCHIQKGANNENNCSC